jgi:cytoskeletal protein RodZ
MKKIIPFFIIIFVFSFVITAGVLILKVGLTNDTSNEKLIEAFINGTASPSVSANTTASTIGFTSLATADSEFNAQPATRESINVGYLAEIVPPTMDTSTDDTASADASDTQPTAAPMAVNSSLQ